MGIFLKKNLCVKLDQDPSFATLMNMYQIPRNNSHQSTDNASQYVSSNQSW